jgi:hypothetical protein
MQTFMPYQDFSKVAKCLDTKRLGKQRVETLQIMRVLAGITNGWANHPAVKMWRGHEQALLRYQEAICAHWTGHYGYKDTCYGKTADAFTQVSVPHSQDPQWLFDTALHLSHQSNLLRKLPDHYGTFWPDVPHDLDYVWPA